MKCLRNIIYKHKQMEKVTLYISTLSEQRKNSSVPLDSSEINLVIKLKSGRSVKGKVTHIPRENPHGIRLSSK